MKYLRWIDSLSDFSGRVASYLLIVMVVVICFDVLMRYLFNQPTTWAYDAALHLYSISFLVGGAWVLKMKAHIKVDDLVCRQANVASAAILTISHRCQGAVAPTL